MGKQRLSDGIDVHYGEYAISGTTVIDSNRNLTNIGTIGSGAITSSGLSRFAGGLAVGPDNDIYFYESSTGNGTIRSGSSGAYKYFTFRSDGSYAIQGGGLIIGSTQVIDSSRNLTNIGTISSGNITATSAGSGNYPFLARYDATYSNNNLGALYQDGAESIFRLYNSAGTTEVQFATGTTSYILNENFGLGTSSINNTTAGRKVVEINGSSTGALLNLSVAGTRRAYFYTTTSTSELMSVSGSLLLRSAGTTALTLDSSQNATFAGSVNLSNGSLSASGTIGNLTAGSIGQQMEKGDASVTTLRFDSNRWRLYAGVDNGESLTVTEGGNVGINTSDPDGQGYSFAEDLVIVGGPSASDGVGITLRGNGKRYGVIAFGDNDSVNVGEIYYDHTGNGMYFRTGGTLRLKLDGNGVDVVTSGTLKMSGTTVITGARVLQNVTANASIITSGTLSADRLNTGSSGNWWSGNPVKVGTDGVSEVGKYLDFHNTDTSTADFDTRLYSSGSNQLTINGAGRVLTTGDEGSGNGLDADTVDGIQASEFLRSNTTDSASGALTYSNTQTWLANTFWQVSSSDTAIQRADARDDDTDKARLHWYGVTASGGTSNFRHAWYDGNSYVNVTAVSDGVDFGGHLNLSSGYGYKINGTTVVDSARNLLNINTINLTSELNFTGNSSKYIDFETLANSDSINLRHHNASTNAFENAAVFTANGGAVINYNNSARLTTTSAGATVGGALTIQTAANGLIFPASHSEDKIRLYSGGSEKIGTASGVLVLTGNSINFKKVGGSPDLQHNGTVFLNSSRDLTNIAAFTSSGDFDQGGTNDRHFVTSSHDLSSGDLNTMWSTNVAYNKSGGIQPFRYQSGATNKPVSQDNANWGLNIYSHPGSTSSNNPYGIQFAGANSDTKLLYLRKFNNGTAGTWYQVPVGGDVANPINLKVTGTMTANNGFKIDSTTVINSSRQLTNIDSITITGQASGGTVLGLENNSWISLKDGSAVLQRVLGASSNTLYVGDVDADFTDMYLRGPATMYIQTNNTTAMTINSSQNVAFAGNISLTGGGVITAPSVSGGEGLGLEAAGTITVRIDTNGNSGDDQFFKVLKHTSDELFTVKENAHVTIGRDGETPLLDLLFDDHASGAGWDTRIQLGKSNDFANTNSFPAYPPLGAYGMNIQANSDGVFFGMEEYTTGNFRPIINWGDDTADSPLCFRFNNASKTTIGTDGTITLEANGCFKTTDSNNGGLQVTSNGTASTGASIGLQQVTSEGDTIIFADYEPHAEWGIYHENNSNLIYISAGGSTANLGSYTVTNRTGNTRTSYIKHEFNQSSGTFRAGGQISSNADVVAYASDRRLKENFVKIESAIEKVQKLNGVTFDWNELSIKEGFEPERRYNDVGLIAQEVQEVCEQAIELAPFDTKVISTPVDPKDKNKGAITRKESRTGENYLTVKYDKLVPLLIEAIKEQQKEIEQLKKHSHPAKDMCDMKGYEELVARIEKMEKNYGNN